MRSLRFAMVGMTVATGLGAQISAVSVPVRSIGPTVTTSPVSFVNPTQLRALADGRVMVLDLSKHTVLLIDNALANPKVVIDSVGGKPNSWGRVPKGAIIPYLADSTLFVDLTASTLLVIDPAGALARVMDLPLTGTATNYLIGANFPMVDHTGRLVYRATVIPPRTSTAAGRAGGSPAPAAPRSPAGPVDTGLVVRTDLTTHASDTLASVKISGGTTAAPLVFPAIDLWAVTNDGGIALLRGQDFHFDWINADGSRTSSGKLPYDWKRLSEAERQHMADSMTAARDERVAKRPANTQYTCNAAGVIIGSTVSLPSPPGAVVPPEGGILPSRLLPSSSTCQQGPISPAVIPEYLPPFSAGALRADLDGRFWIQMSPPGSETGSIIFDVVNRNGVLIDRVQLPTGRTLLGFGPGDIVYMVSHDAGVSHVEKARFK